MKKNAPEVPMYGKTYLYSAMTLAMVSMTVSIVDRHIPNSVWYYVGLCLPF